MVDNISPNNTNNNNNHHHHTERERGVFNSYYSNYDAFVGSGNSSSGVGEDELGLLKEQDRLLPIANVGRIMKQILPPNAKISKEAKETMQECVSEFISFVTGEASDKCHKEKRKTVNGDDICWALGSLGFDDYADPLKRYLGKYREAEGERANQNKAATTTAVTMEEREESSMRRGVSTAPFSFNLMEKRRVN